MKRVCVFCGASNGGRPTYVKTAYDFGKGLAERGLELVYGGGNVGLMGAVADGCVEGGGKVIGVIPSSLQDKELAHNTLTELHVVKTMHERKAMMADFADAFVALPGGFGTLDELCEIVTWAQLGFHQKPIGMLNHGGFYDGFLAFIDHASAEGFISSRMREVIVVKPEVTELLDVLVTYQPPQVDRWIERKDL